jgi:predicted AAA+ superfamily ATPase
MRILKRKISTYLEQHLGSDSDKILLIEGARQVGKSFAIREVGQRLFSNYVEINFVTDSEGARLFEDVHTVDAFYLRLSSVAGDKLGQYENTLIFIDEIQCYPQYFTLLKFLREQHKYHFIASGSALGIALRRTTSIPVGSVILKQMYPLDFEEFLWANNYGIEAIEDVYNHYVNNQSLEEKEHEYLLDLFRRYLLVGGLPDVVNEYLSNHNIVSVRNLQNAITTMYETDASQYENSASRKLMIRRIYSMVVSLMENKKKRIVVQDIQDKKGDRFVRYADEFEYLLSSAITLGVNAIANPRFPLAESLHKNLLKLYLNDVGLLTAKLFATNIKPILQNERSINIGAVYESVVAQELVAHGYPLFYYDNRQKGEVDFIVDDYEHSSVLPIEVKSGRDYTIHSALTNMVNNADYGVKKAIVLSNERTVEINNNIIYMPIYYIMFVNRSTDEHQSSILIF